MVLAVFRWGLTSSLDTPCAPVPVHFDGPWLQLGKSHHIVYYYECQPMIRQCEVEALSSEAALNLLHWQPRRNGVPA